MRTPWSFVPGRAVRLTVALMLASCDKAPVNEAKGSARIQLTELSALSLPPAFGLRGAGLTADGTLLYWSDTSAHVAYSDGRANLRLCGRVLRRVVAAAFVAADSVVELIDAAEPSIIRAGPSNTCARSPIRPHGSEVIAAVFSPDGWTVTLRRGLVTADVMRVVFGTGATKLYEFSHHPRSPFDLEAAYVTAASTGTLRSSMNWPFEWAALDTAGNATLSGQGVERTVEGLADTTLVDWVGLPVVQLDSGFLQTLADPRSDHRWLLLYDRDGRVVSRTALQVAFGILRPGTADTIGA